MRARERASERVLQKINAWNNIDCSGPGVFVFFVVAVKIQTYRFWKHMARFNVFLRRFSILMSVSVSSTHFWVLLTFIKYKWVRTHEFRTKRNSVRIKYMLYNVHDTLINRLVRCFSFFSLSQQQQQSAATVNAGKKTEIKLQTYVRCACVCF